MSVHVQYSVNPTVWNPLAPLLAGGETDSPLALSRRMASIDDVRDRARRGKPESNEDAVKSLLTDDRLHRVEQKLREDREARVKLEALVALQQQTIEFLRSKIDSQEELRGELSTSRAVPAHSAHRVLELEDQIRSTQAQNAQLIRRVTHLEKQHSVIELSTRVGMVEARMLSSEHVAETVQGHVRRHTTPLLEHITDLIDDLHSRVDAIEDTIAQLDAERENDSQASLVRRECAQIVAEMLSASGAVASASTRTSVIVASPPTAAELATYTSKASSQQRELAEPQPESEPEPEPEQGVPEAVPGDLLPTLLTASSSGTGVAMWGISDAAEDEMTPRTESRWIKEEATRRLAAEMSKDASNSGAATSSPLVPPLLRPKATADTTARGPPPLPSRDSRGLSGGEKTSDPAGKLSGLHLLHRGEPPLSLVGGADEATGADDTAGDGAEMTPRTEERWIKQEAERLVKLEQAGATS